MAKDIHVPAKIVGGKIPVKASLGQTVIVTEGPETYTGPVTITPTETEQILLTKDKLVTDNISVNPIPSEYTDAKVNYDNALVAFGVESDLADGISALTTYSNSVTGEQDENLSDAVRTLCDGYGQGAQNVVTGTFIGNGTTEITISAHVDPDIVIAYSPNKLADYAVNAAWYFFLGPMVAVLPRRTTSGYGASANVIDLPASNNKPGKTYVDGALTLLANGSIYQFANGATYNYILVKL